MKTSVFLLVITLIVFPIVFTTIQGAAVTLELQKIANPTRIKVIRRLTQKVTMSPVDNPLGLVRSVGITESSSLAVLKPKTAVLKAKSAILTKKLTFTRKRIGLPETAINVLFNKGLREKVRNAICESVHETYLNPWLKVMTLLCARKADKKMFSVKMHVRTELR